MEQEAPPPDLNDDVLLLVAEQGLSCADVLSCRLVCKAWRSSMSHAVRGVLWSLSTPEPLTSLLSAFPSRTCVTIAFPEVRACRERAVAA